MYNRKIISCVINIRRVQEILVLKDFDIAADAGGAGKPVVKTFTAVVKRNTLKIHLYWAGRGTQGVPDRGNYGPLISAISVEPGMLVSLILRKTKIITSFYHSTERFSISSCYTAG